MKWSLRGGEVGSEYKGSDRHVMIASISKPQGYKWSHKAGLLNRETNEPITKDPKQDSRINTRQRCNSKRFEQCGNNTRKN